MMAPAAPPTTAPMIAPRAVEPVWFPMTPPTAPPAVAPITAPFCLRLIDEQLLAMTAKDASEHITSTVRDVAEVKRVNRFKSRMIFLD